MHNRKREEIENNHVDKETFSVIINNNSNPLTWNEIMKYLAYATEATYSKKEEKGVYAKKYFIIPTDLTYLEDLGIDYNHIDSLGNNFLHYIYECSNTTSSPLRFYEEVRDYVTSKTHNVYHINNKGITILFNAISFLTSGINQKHFFDLLEKYPNFDLHHRDNSGRNLLNHALAYHSPLEITQFFFDKELSRTHTFGDNQNTLETFSFLGFDEKHVQWLTQLIKEIDITSDPTFKHSFLSNWMNFYISDTVHQSNKSQYIKWINTTLSLISQGEFLYTSDSINVLHNFLTSKQATYLKMVKKLEEKKDYLLAYDTYEMALKGLRYLQLNESLPQQSSIAKAKI